MINPSTATVPAFRPYRGDDVATGPGESVRISLPGLGEVWAMVAPVPLGWKKNVNNDPFTVSILGWGEAPCVWWNELTDEQRRLLATTLTNEDRTGFVPMLGPNGEHRAQRAVFDLDRLAWWAVDDDGSLAWPLALEDDVHTTEADALQTARARRAKP